MKTSQKEINSMVLRNNRNNIKRSEEIIKLISRDSKKQSNWYKKLKEIIIDINNRTDIKRLKEEIIDIINRNNIN